MSEHNLITHRECRVDVDIKEGLASLSNLPAKADMERFQRKYGLTICQMDDRNGIVAQNGYFDVGSRRIHLHSAWLLPGQRAAGARCRLEANSSDSLEVLEDLWSLYGMDRNEFRLGISELRYRTVTKVQFYGALACLVGIGRQGPVQVEPIFEPFPKVPGKECLPPHVLPETMEKMYLPECDFSARILDLNVSLPNVDVGVTGFRCRLATDNVEDGFSNICHVETDLPFDSHLALTEALSTLLW